MVLRPKKIFTNLSTVIKVCLDSNVLISAFIFSGKPAQIFDLAVEKNIKLITSPEILSEVASVLSRKFDQDERVIKKQIKTINDVSKIVIPKRKLKVLRYKPDNKVLEVCLGGEVDYLVTGDKKHLLPLKQFQGIPIVTPDQFLKEFETK